MPDELYIEPSGENIIVPIDRKIAKEFLRLVAHEFNYAAYSHVYDRISVALRNKEDLERLESLQNYNRIENITIPDKYNEPQT